MVHVHRNLYTHKHSQRYTICTFKLVGLQTYEYPLLCLCLEKRKRYLAQFISTCVGCMHVCVSHLREPSCWKRRRRVREKKYKCRIESAPFSSLTQTYTYNHTCWRMLCIIISSICREKSTHKMSKCERLCRQRDIFEPPQCLCPFGRCIRIENGITEIPVCLAWYLLSVRIFSWFGERGGGGCEVWLSWMAAAGQN